MRKHMSVILILMLRGAMRQARQLGRRVFVFGVCKKRGFILDSINAVDGAVPIAPGGDGLLLAQPILHI
jgi:hypothetical protein